METEYKRISKNDGLIKVDVICDYCGKSYKKVKTEYVRNLKLNRKSYCSRSCAGKVVNHHAHLQKWMGNISNFGTKIRRGSEKDEYTPFRKWMRRIKSRTRTYDLTLDDLKEQWEKQRGVCPYTGVLLENVGDGVVSSTNINYRASLDRIDSTKGYIKGNIQFISVAANYAKSTMTDEQMKEFIRIVKES